MRFPSSTGTYSDLQQKFAAAVPEADAALSAQSQEVRQSYGLLSLVSQLRQGPWAQIDTTGVKSAAQEGFALWIYQQLLPTMYDRYEITNCTNKVGYYSCDVHGATDNYCGDYPGVAPADPHYSCTPNFNMIASPPTPVGPGSGSPCLGTFGVNGPGATYCDFQPLPTNIATTVWGHISQDCQYDPNSPNPSNTVWHYGCNLGVNPWDSIGFRDGPASDWNFSNVTGSPVVENSYGALAVQQSVRGTAAVGANGSVTIAGTIPVSPGLRIETASANPARVLSQPGGSGALVSAAAAAGGGGVRASAAAVRSPRVRVRLGKVSRGRQPFTVTVSNVDVALPGSCQQLPASASLQAAPFELVTTLEVKQGGKRRTLSLPSRWRCTRGRNGAVARLVTANGTPVTRRVGLRMSVSGPRTIVAGSRATFVVHIHNRRRRRRGKALLTSLWNVVVHGAVGPPRLDSKTKVVPLAQYRWTQPRLRPGRSITLRLPVRPPSRSAGRACVTAIAAAESARLAVIRRCFTVVRRRPSGSRPRAVPALG